MGVGSGLRTTIFRFQVREVFLINVTVFQVAERALFLWNNEYIASMTSDHAETVLPLLYPALHRNSKNHWNATVHSLTFNIIKMFMEMNDELFQECRHNYEIKEQNDESESKKHSENWEQITRMANIAVEVRNVPARSDQKESFNAFHLLSDHLSDSVS